MATQPSVVAIWLTSSTCKKDYKIVPVNHLKSFSPARCDDFLKNRSYKYKPPGAQRSIYAHILGLDVSHDTLQKKLAEGRIAYPSRRYVDRDAIPSTTEDEETKGTAKRSSQASAQNNVLRSGMEANMQDILQKYNQSKKSDLDVNQKDTNNSKNFADGSRAPKRLKANGIDDLAYPSNCSSIPEDLPSHKRSVIAGNEFLKPNRSFEPKKAKPCDRPEGVQLNAHPQQSKTVANVNISRPSAARTTVAVIDSKNEKVPECSKQSKTAGDKNNTAKSKEQLNLNAETKQDLERLLKELEEAKQVFNTFFTQALNEKDRAKSSADKAEASQKQAADDWLKAEECRKQAAEDRRKAQEYQKQAAEDRREAEAARKSCEQLFSLFNKEKNKLLQDHQNLMQKLNHLKRNADFTEGEPEINSGVTNSEISHNADQKISLHTGTPSDLKVSKYHWDMANRAKSREDWAHHVLLGIFGNEAKFYRCSKPRRNDDRLRTFPEDPPVIAVLQGFYKNWLQQHPQVVDKKKKVIKKRAKDGVVPPNNIPEDEYEGLSPDEITAKRNIKIARLVDNLGSLLGDKATDLYRRDNRRRKAATPKPPALNAVSDGDSSSNEQDQNQGGADQIIITDRQSQIVTAIRSPLTRAQTRAQEIDSSDPDYVPPAYVPEDTNSSDTDYVSPAKSTNQQDSDSSYVD